MFDRPYNLSPNILTLEIVEVWLYMLHKIYVSDIRVTFGLWPGGNAM
jgi:hypothetical protein